jgi:hypothetical protein
MSNRQLALIFALISAVFALLITALCMIMRIPPGIPVILSILMFNGTSIVQMSMARKKWDLDYRNALLMLAATSIPCAIIYTFGFQFLESTFPGYLREGPTQFWPFFFGCVLFRLPGDAIIAIFHKRKA